MSQPLFIAAGGPVIPSFGQPSHFACEAANRTFCWGWFKQNWGSVLRPELRSTAVLLVIAIQIPSEI